MQTHATWERLFHHLWPQTHASTHVRALSHTTYAHTHARTNMRTDVRTQVRACALQIVLIQDTPVLDHCYRSIRTIVRHPLDEGLRAGRDAPEADGVDGAGDGEGLIGRHQLQSHAQNQNTYISLSSFLCPEIWLLRSMVLEEGVLVTRNLRNPGHEERLVERDQQGE